MHSANKIVMKNSFDLCTEMETMKVKLTREMKAAFALLLEQHPPQQFSTDLRRMLLDYMVAEVEIGFHIEFRRLLWAMNDLFDLLDAAAKEMEDNKRKLKKASK